MTTYISPAWERILARNSGYAVAQPGFSRHLRAIARPLQIAYQQIMAQGNGNPVGIECRSASRDAWAFVLPEVAQRDEYAYRVQYFDRDGFSGHFCYATLKCAVSGLIADGYRIIDCGALDKCASTERWAMGVKRNDIRTLFNRGLIGWNEMFEQFESTALSA